MVLDLGAGTGAVSAQLHAVGARPLALDASRLMLTTARRRSASLPAVVADATRLPFLDHCFDAALAGFVLNHVPEPWRVLAEAARVTRQRGVLMAMTFAAGDEHPAKTAVESVAARWGWEPPLWYQEQRGWAALTGTAAGLQAQAKKAGLEAANVDLIDVSAGLRSAVELANWRLGMAHMAEFTMALPRTQRQRLVAEAAEAVGPQAQPLRREVLVLSSHLPA
jgi:SAM-dependent methyltransferase